VTRLLFFTLPLPLQALQGLWMIFPVPRQRAQAAVLEKAKPPVRCCTRTTPVPRQSGQVSAVVPGSQPEPWQAPHSSLRFRLISFSQPKAASSKLMARDRRILSPRWGALGFVRRPPQRLL